MCEEVWVFVSFALTGPARLLTEYSKSILCASSLMLKDKMFKILTCL